MKRYIVIIILVLGMCLGLSAEEALNVPILYPQIVIIDSDTAIVPSLNCILELDLKTQKAKILLQLRVDAFAVPMARDLEKARFSDMVKITYFNRSTNDLFFEWSDTWAYNTYRYSLDSEELEYLGEKENIGYINQFRRYEVYNRSTKKFEKYFKATWEANGTQRLDYAFPNDVYSLSDPFIDKWMDSYVLCSGQDVLVLATKRRSINPIVYGYLIGSLSDSVVAMTELALELDPSDGHLFLDSSPDVRDDMHYEPQIFPPFFAQIQDGVFYFMTAWKVQEFHDPKVGTGDDPESQAYRLITVKQYDRESKEVKTVLEDVYDYTLPYSFYVYDGFIYYFKFNGFRKCATLYRKALAD